jgi:cyclic-di-GMP-binding protein
MPSFDVISEVDQHELTNAVDQANREIGTRFDFKGVDASYELKDSVVTLSADAEFQINQMMDILKAKLVKRGIDITAIKPDEKVEVVGQKATLKCTIIQGIEAEIARKIVKHVKDLKMKVQIAIQGDKLRVTGNKRDDLQAVIAVLRKGEFGLPLQYDNFRD